MRKDMAKVIVERPRVGGHNIRPGRAQALEDLPLREGMRPRRSAGIERKILNEHLKPLKRYLHKQVGRPWNLVYSEICKNLRVTSAVQQHVRGHVWDYVEREVTMVGKVPHHSYWFGRLIRMRRGKLYINPDTGLLCKVK